MGKTTIEVQHDNNPNVTYSPGQMIQGKAIVHNEDRIEVRGVRVKFLGQARVRWSEGSGKNRRTYTSWEAYFESECVVFGKPSNSSEKTELGPGTHTFPFQYQLPPGIPSSFEGGIGRVAYSIVVTVDKPWAFDVTAEAPFFVFNWLDLNQEPDALSETANTNEKTICCLCCASGPLTSKVRVPRKGYVPGETVQVFCEMENYSNRNMTQCYVALIKVVEFHVRTKTRRVPEELCRIQGPAIAPGGTHHFHGETLVIPPGLMPSYLRGCSIIDIHYYVCGVMDPAGPALDLSAPAEITIGTVPLTAAAAANMGTMPMGIPRPVGTAAVPAQNMPAFSQNQYGVDAADQQYGTTQQYGGMDFGGGETGKYGSAFDY